MPFQWLQMRIQEERERMPATESANAPSRSRLCLAVWCTPGFLRLAGIGQITSLLCRDPLAGRPGVLRVEKLASSRESGTAIHSLYFPNTLRDREFRRLYRESTTPPPQMRWQPRIADIA